MRCNVDLLRIIQIGLTLADENGNMPEDVCTWQFNFVFDLSEDMFSPDSIDLLRSSGIDFQRHATEGIQPNDFAELLITSGLVLSEDTKWICFHAYVYLLLAASRSHCFFQRLRFRLPCQTSFLHALTHNGGRLLRHVVIMVPYCVRRQVHDADV